MTLERCTIPPLSELGVPTLSEQSVQPTYCIHTGTLFNLHLVTLERRPLPPLKKLIQPVWIQLVGHTLCWDNGGTLSLPLVTLEGCPVPPLSEQRVWATNCINTGWMSFFNLQLVTLERFPVPPLSEWKGPPLSEWRVQPTCTNYICTSWFFTFSVESIFLSFSSFLTSLFLSF